MAPHLAPSSTRVLAPEWCRFFQRGAACGEDGWDKTGGIGPRYARKVPATETPESWVFRADDPTRSPAYWQCFWWDDWCAERFSALWGPEADEIADELADLYAFAWPWLISRVLRSRAPRTHQRIEAFTSSDELLRRAKGTNPLGVLEMTTMWGAYQMVRARRSWRDPSTATCPICGSRFWTGLPHWT